VVGGIYWGFGGIVVWFGRINQRVGEIPVQFGEINQKIGGIPLILSLKAKQKERGHGKPRSFLL
jgi:hypothetical protein